MPGRACLLSLCFWVQQVHPAAASTTAEEGFNPYAQGDGSHVGTLILSLPPILLVRFEADTGVCAYPYVGLIPCVLGTTKPPALPCYCVHGMRPTVATPLPALCRDQSRGTVPLHCIHHSSCYLGGNAIPGAVFRTFPPLLCPSHSIRCFASVTAVV